MKSKFECQDISIFTTKDFSQFRDIIHELAPTLGPRFPVSISNWCGLGKRKEELDYWHVYLILFSDQIVGVCGLYRNRSEPYQRIWLGWLGVKREYRRSGIATKVIEMLIDIALRQSCKELFVYVDANDSIAQQFYRSLGFDFLGTASEICVSNVSDPQDLILRKIIST